MLTLKFHEQDIPFLFAAIREHTSSLLNSISMQIDMQTPKPAPIPAPEIKMDAPPVEATVTPRRGPGRPKGVKHSVKRRSPKRGASK